MKNFLRILLITLVVTLAGFSIASSQDNHKSSLQISISMGNANLSGFTQYELNIPIYSDIDQSFLGNGHSRLKFPYSSYLTGGVMKVEYRNFMLSLGYWGQYRSQVDEYFEDFDWITGDGTYQELAYGRADPDPDFDYWETEFSYKFNLASFHIRPLFHYQRVNSDFTMTDLEQTWYVNLDDGTIYDPPQERQVSGNVLYYSQELDLPYFAVGFGYEVFKDRLYLELILGGTFLAHVKDYDDHIVRSDSLDAWNSGSMGQGVLGGLNVTVNVFEAFWAGINFSYRDYNIDTDGIQRYLNDDDEFVLASTDTEVRGLIRNLRVTISYFFM